jgi:hypothetical protein
MKKSARKLKNTESISIIANTNITENQTVKNQNAKKFVKLADRKEYEEFLLLKERQKEEQEEYEEYKKERFEEGEAYESYEEYKTRKKRAS